MPKPRTPGDLGLVPGIVFTACHGVLWAFLVLASWWVVPRFARTFTEFDMPLPGITQWTFHWSAVAARYWYLAVICGTAGVALNFLLLLGAGWVGRGVQTIAGVLLTVVPLALIAVLLLAVGIPLVRLITALQ
jgi:type II secretory pathway component PulF